MCLALFEFAQGAARSKPHCILPKNAFALKRRLGHSDPEGNIGGGYWLGGGGAAFGASFKSSEQGTSNSSTSLSIFSCLIY